MYSLCVLALISAPTESATRSLSLAEAVQLALRTEPQVRRAQLERQRGELGVTRANLDRVSVKVDAQLQELWAKSNIGGAGDSPSAFLGLSNVALNVSVPVFSGFRVESNVDRAEHLEQAAAQDVLGRRQETALAVGRAYWAVRKLGLLADAQARALERLRGLEDIAASRVRSGLAPPIDQNRAISRRMLQEATLADLQGQLLRATEELAVALGLSQALRLVEEPAEQDPPAAALELLLAEARGHRPELAGAARRLEAQAAQVRMEESGYYPQLAAFSLLQFGNNPFQAGTGARGVGDSANPFKNAAGDFQIGLSLSINIFDTLNTRTAVQNARYQESLLAEELRQAERKVESEVRTARAKLGHFRGVRARLQPAEIVAKDNVQIITKRYENGEALVFELLDAELELLGIERQLTEATSDLQVARLELEAAQGKIVGEEP